LNCSTVNIRIIKDNSMAGHIAYMAKRRKEQEVLITMLERHCSTWTT
jgi:hypothetical protein